MASDRFHRDMEGRLIGASSPTQPRPLPRRAMGMTQATPAAGAAAPVAQTPTPAPASRPPPQPTQQATDAYGRAQAPTQQFTATNNLRGTQINPGLYGGPASQVQAMGLNQLAGLQGPDRGEIAQDVFSQIREASEPRFQQDLQNVGRRAASLGRLGAGMTTSELGDVVSNRERNLGLAARNLASEAAGQSLNDRLGVFDATMGAQGQFFGQGLAQRDELRGERGFQNQMQQQALQDYIRQRSLEEMLLQGEYGRDMGMNQLLLGYGYGG